MTISATAVAQLEPVSEVFRLRDLRVLGRGMLVDDLTNPVPPFRRGFLDCGGPISMIDRLGTRQIGVQSVFVKRALRRYWGGKWGRGVARRRHCDEMRHSATNHRRHRRLIRALAPPLRSKSLQFDAHRIRLDDG